MKRLIPTMQTACSARGCRFSARNAGALLVFVLAAAVWLSCASEPRQPPASMPKPGEQQAETEPPPADYELRIISWLRMNAADPDSVNILSISPPQRKIVEASSPETGLEKGDLVWESLALVGPASQAGGSAAPAQRRFYFKDGVIRAVDLN